MNTQSLFLATVSLYRTLGTDCKGVVRASTCAWRKWGSNVCRLNV